MYQQWLQIIGLMLDGLGFGLIALEWYRGYREMRKKVDLVSRNMERAEKIRLRDHIKQAIGMAGVGEVEALYKDDKALAEMAEHAFEIDQVDRFARNARPPVFCRSRRLPGRHGAAARRQLAGMLCVHWHHSAVTWVSMSFPMMEPRSAPAHFWTNGRIPWLS